jgi:hypothetical protein
LPLPESRAGRHSRTEREGYESLAGKEPLMNALLAMLPVGEPGRYRTTPDSIVYLHLQRVRASDDEVDLELWVTSFDPVRSFLGGFVHGLEMEAEGVPLAAFLGDPASSFFEVGFNPKLARDVVPA